MKTTKSVPTPVQTVLMAYKEMFLFIKNSNNIVPTILAGIIPSIFAFATVVIAAIGLALLLNLLVMDALLGQFSAEGWYAIVRSAISIAIIAGLLAGGYLVYASIALVYGESIYNKLWKKTELARYGYIPKEEPGFKATVQEALIVIGKSILISFGAFLLALIPVVGSLMAIIFTVVFSGYALSKEFTNRAFEARGYDRNAKAEILGRHRAATVLFGASLYGLLAIGNVITVFLMPHLVIVGSKFAHVVLDMEQESLMNVKME